MNSVKKRFCACSLAFAIISSTFLGCSNPSKSSKASTTASASSEKANPFKKFDKPVTIHIGQQAYPTQKFPSGDTNENNVFTRYLKDNFNINVVVDWSAATGDAYNQKVNLCIASNKVPDGMQCDRNAMLSAAKSDELYDFTNIFPQYASPQIKSLLNADNGLAYQYAKYNGKQLCMVGVDVEPSGQSMLNIRKDWLDKYGLQVPKTLDEIEQVAKVFKEKKPAGTDTVPIAGPDKNSTCYTNFLQSGVMGCGFEPVYAAYDAYPGYWYKDNSDQVVYGSNTANSKKALSRLAKWYSEGLIDPEMGVRDSSTELVNSGKVGMYFCAWWMVGYGTTDAYKNDPNANWQTYAVKTDDGKWNTRMQCPVASYVVCSKNISDEVAQAAIIMNNVWVRDENKLTNMSTTSIYWYPLRNSMGALDECSVTYNALQKVLNGQATVKNYNKPDSAYKLLYSDATDVTKDVKNYKKGEDLSISNFNTADASFARLYSILIGSRPSSTLTPNKKIYSLVYSQTPTMQTKWANLNTLETENTLKIITGKENVNTFDSYVKQWNTEGGKEITSEVEKEAGDK